MKLAQRIFNGLTRGLDKLSVGFAHASAFFEMLGIGASVEPADPIEATVTRIDEETAVARLVLAYIAYSRGGEADPIEEGLFSDPYWNRDGQRPLVAPSQKAQPDVAWWRTASDTEKAEKRMELRAQFGRKGPPPPHRAPGDWQWRVHMERQALAKDRAELESLRTSAQRLGRVGDLRARIARHEHTLAQMRGQYLRPKKPKPIKWGPCQVCGEACDLEGATATHCHDCVEGHD